MTELQKKRLIDLMGKALCTSHWHGVFNNLRIDTTDEAFRIITITAAKNDPNKEHFYKAAEEIIDKAMKDGEETTVKE